METIKKIILIIILIPFAGFSQDYFYKKYRSVSSFNEGYGITQLPDSTYAVTGMSGGFDEHSSQAFLMLVDKMGEQIWTKSYGGAGDDIGVRVFHVENEGFYIAGYSSSTLNGDYDFMVIKTDESGNTDWIKYYGTGNWEILRDAQILADGGLILVGETVGVTTNGKDGYMARIDAAGSVVWEKSVGIHLDEVIYAVDTINTNMDFVVGGVFADVVEENLIGTVIRFDSNGNEVWRHRFEQAGEKETAIHSIDIAVDTIYAFGDVYFPTEDYRASASLKLSVNGDFYLSHNSHYVTGETQYTAAVFRDEFGIYAAWQSTADELTPYSGGFDAYITRLEFNLNYYNASAGFSGIGNDIINQLIVTLDDGIAFVGTASDREDDSGGSYNQLLGTVVMIGKLDSTDQHMSNQLGDLGDLVSTVEEQINTVKIYPNPTSYKINLPPELNHLDYKVMNAQGQIVLDGQIQEEIEVANLTNGLYFLIIKDDQRIWTGKFLKE